MSMQERIPPHNLDAEKSVLGAVLLDKDAMYEVVETLREDDFYSKNHQEIFSAVVEIYKKNEPVDIMTLSEALKKRNTLEIVGGRAYLGHLSAFVPSTANIESYAKIVEEKAVLRRLITASSEIMESSYDAQNEANMVIDLAEKSIFDISQKRQSKGFEKLGNVIISNIKEMDEMAMKDGDITGLTTGFKVLDEKTSGLQKSDLIFVAARPSMGKTAFVLNVAQNAAKEGASVAVFSLEMSKEQLAQRMLSSEANVEISKLRTAKLEQNEWEKVYIGMDKLQKTKVHIDDSPGITPMEIKNKCRRLKTESELDLIIIDYLQLMSGDSKTENRQQEISVMSRSLKHLAREMDCPVIALSQLSRAPEMRADHRPILSDLRESGSIEQDADIVMFLYRDEYYHPDDSEKPGICEISIAKQRNGSTGVIDLAWIGQYTKFANIYSGQDQ